MCVIFVAVHIESWKQTPFAKFSYMDFLDATLCDFVDCIKHLR
jgi:hypothetical protein